MIRLCPYLINFHNLITPITMSKKYKKKTTHTKSLKKKVCLSVLKCRETLSIRVIQRFLKI